MLWFFVTGVLLLVGAEITAALARELTPAEIRRRGEEQAAAEAVDDAKEQAVESVRSATHRSA